MNNTKMNALDRAIASFAPKWALSRQKARFAMNGIQALGQYAGEKTRRILKNWSPSIGDANTELSLTLPILRGRTRDLYDTNTTGRGAITENVVNVVGPGLKLESRVDTQILGLSPEKAQEVQSLIERRWQLWASSKEADSFQQRNFYALTAQALTGMMIDGDIISLLKIINKNKNRPNAVSPLAIQLVGAHQLCNKNNMTDTETLKSGVEIDSNGAPVAYHICNPDMYAVDGSMSGTWTRVSRYGSRSGRLNVVHFMPQDGRPGQVRGVPYLAPIIEMLKQLERYSEAELTAAVVSAYFTVFIENESGDIDDSPVANALDENSSTIRTNTDSSYIEPSEYKMNPGTILALNPGEKIATANPQRPNTAFGDFVESLFKQIGMGLNLPYEVLTRHFSSSYSASRAALLDAWKGFFSLRSWTAQSFCQPIYETWMELEVLEGRLNLPGFMSDPAMRAAWTRAVWHGPSKGMIDPLKEAKAAVMLVDNKLSTREKQAREMDGEDWYNTIERLSYEDKKIKELGIAEEAQTVANGAGANNGQ